MLAVKPHSSNPDKHPLMPDQWPWMVVPASQVPQEELSQWTLMTEEELGALKVTLRPLYQQYEAALQQQESLQRYIEEKIKQAIAFGQQLMIEFSSQNVLMGITQQNKTKAVSDYLNEVQRYLLSGSLYEVVKEIDRLQQAGIPENLAPFVTQERLNQFKQKILNFLNHGS